MALSSTTPFTRAERMEGSGESSVITGLSEYHALMMQVQRFDDDGPPLHIHFMDSLDGVLWREFYSRSLNNSNDTIIDHHAFWFGDYLKVRYEVREGPGVGGCDFEVKVAGRV